MTTHYAPHSCTALLFLCMDFRLHPQVIEALQKQEGQCDLCVTAGSIKALLDEKTRDFILQHIALSEKLHHARKVILTIHRDCGAYGGSKAFETQETEFDHHKARLQEATALIHKQFPSMEVAAYVIELTEANGEWKTSLVPV